MPNLFFAQPRSTSLRSYPAITPVHFPQSVTSTFALRAKSYNTSLRPPPLDVHPFARAMNVDSPSFLSPKSFLIGSLGKVSPQILIV